MLRFHRGGFAAAVVVAAAVFALTNATASAAEPAARPLAAADKKSLDETLRKVFAALPAPAKAFRLDKESGSTEIALSASPWAVAVKAPAEARGVKVYEETNTKSGVEPSNLEVRVYVNQERSLPEPLGSEGGALETFTHDGLPGARYSLAGVTPGRVALPLTAEQEANALTVVRLHIGADAIEPYLLEVAQGRRPPGTPWDQTPAAKASEIRTVVVEYYGPHREVERLLAATKAAPLKALVPR